MDQELKAYLDEQFKTVAKKVDVENAVTELAAHINETIAVPMEQHFAEVKDNIDVRAEVETLKLDMQKIKEALHLT